MGGGMEKMLIPCALLIVILYKMFRTAWWMGLVGLIMCLFFLRKHLAVIWRRFTSSPPRPPSSAEEQVQLIAPTEGKTESVEVLDATVEAGDGDAKVPETSKPPASCVNAEPPSTTPTHEPERQELYTRDPKLKANYTGEHEVRNRLNQENLPLPTGQAMREFAKELCKNQVHHKDAYMVAVDAEDSQDSLAADRKTAAEYDEAEDVEDEVDAEDFIMED